MSERETGQWIPDDDQVAAELRLAVHAGDIEAIQRLLRRHPALATARLGSRETGTTTPLHLVTDWPGYFLNGPQIVRLLIDAGADPNALTTSRGAQTSSLGDETPLHYAASSDDVDVAEALIDGGADIETPDGSIGTPLDNAVGYGCWHVARLLVARGARVEAAWHAAALGMLGRLDAILGSDPPTADDAITRPGGAWHHLADGLPSAEIAAASRMLAEAARVIPDAERAAFDELRAHVATLDGAEGLPEGLIHSDFVLANVVATPGGMVLVDWAGAGRGPRLWSLAFLLYAEAVKEPRRAGAVLLGYREHVTLEADELDRLAAVAQAQPPAVDGPLLRATSIARSGALQRHGLRNRGRSRAPAAARGLCPGW